jgi:hypothetical protein
MIHRHRLTNLSILLLLLTLSVSRIRVRVIRQVCAGSKRSGIQNSFVSNRLD